MWHTDTNTDKNNSVHNVKYIISKAWEYYNRRIQKLLKEKYSNKWDQKSSQVHKHGSLNGFPKLLVIGPKAKKGKRPSGVNYEGGRFLERTCSSRAASSYKANRGSRLTLWSCSNSKTVKPIEFNFPLLIQTFTASK